jgi:hypothetical protein
MSFQTPITIEEALNRVHRHEFVLPAIQREFVWRPEQICRLFDSLMQGYPIGSFLFWHVDRENVHDFKFYDFVTDYHQKLRPHCPTVTIPTNTSVTAILDGQQRLTALNIGLWGSHAQKEPRKWWSSPDAFPEKRLYLNIADTASENEGGLEYDFRFLTEERTKHTSDGETHWFRVGKILEFEDATDIFDYIQQQGLANNKMAFRMLALLHKVLRTDGLVAYFEERSQDIEKVLNIFIRTNSGGTVLSYSDLLLSIATAQWDKLDARKEIHGLVDDLNSTRFGFSFSKDFVLKAGLMLADIGSVGFKVVNFNRKNMAELERQWREISAALRLTVQLVADFGFSGRTLGADNALLPIAYYIYQRRLGTSYLTSSAHTVDRAAIQGWLIRSLLKAGVWGSGLDTTLTALRATLKQYSDGRFPADQLETTLRSRGRGLRFEQEELEDLVDVGYGDRRSFAILALLFPFHDLRHEFHVDHIFPKSLFTPTKLSTAGFAEHQHADLRDQMNRLANLQLLDGVVNKEKGATLPASWIASAYPLAEARAGYVDRHLIGQLPADLNGFPDFYEARRAELLTKLSEVLG